jgi:ATP-binding cassette, subfamily B, bacterial
MARRSESRWSALGALLWPDRARWFVLGALVACTSALMLAGPLVVRRLVDRAAAGAGSNEISGLAVLYLVIALLTQLVAVLVAWRATTAAWTTTNQLRLDMARHVLGLDHEFHRTHTPGELIQRVDGDVTSVSEFLGLVVPKAFGAGLLISGMVVVLAVLDWRLAVGLVVYLGFTFWIVVRSRHRAVTESADEMGSLGRLYGGIEERLVAAEDLRSNGAGAHVAWRFVEDSADALASTVRRERAFLTMWWFVQLALAAGWVVVLVFGAWTVSRDLASIGTIFLLYQYILLVGRPLEDLVHQLETVQKANGAMVRVLDLLAIRPNIVDGGTTSPAPGPLDVRFRDVAFDYGDDQPVLRGVDLTFAAGRSVGIVGRTGSGKTTLSRLVLRLVEPTNGVVELGGVPIGEIPVGELRRRVALVSQEVELFAGSIRDNVTLFDDSIDDATVVDALRAVGLGALADAGIERELGAAGTGLSAGEAQLLSLARVWMRDPDVLVLDEATARIDPQTEQQIEAAIARLMVGRTTLVIAHRLATLHAVDDIVVFERGAVAEFGARADLVGDDESQFARLVLLTLEGDDSPSAADDDDDDDDDADDDDDDDGGARMSAIARVTT